MFQFFRLIWYIGITISLMYDTWNLKYVTLDLVWGWGKEKGKVSDQRSTSTSTSWIDVGDLAL